MIPYLAEIITDFFVKTNVIKKEDSEIYQYGNEMAISTVIDILILIIVALITKEFFAVMIFWISFFTLRKFGGGYHASTYFKCKVIFVINLLLIILMGKYLTHYYNLYVWGRLCLFSELVICNLSPIVSCNKPMDIYEIKINATRCKITSAIIITASLLLYMLKSYISLILVLTLFSVSAAMIIEYFWKGGEPDETSENGG